MSNIATVSIFPLICIVFGALFWAAVHLGMGLPLASFGVTVVNLLIIAVAEKLLPIREDHSLFRDRQSFNDVAHGLLASEVGGRSARALIDVVFVAAFARIAAAFDLATPLWPGSLPIWIQFAIVFILIELIFYFQHRMFHSVPILWRFHALHHNAERMHVLTGIRLHFLEILVRHFLMFAPLILLGAPGDLLIFYVTVQNLIGHLAHANIDCKFPKWMHWILVTPAVHHLHHSKKREQSDSNFSSIVSVPDVLFGTFKDPVVEHVEDFGIEQDPLGRAFHSQLLRSFDPGAKF